MPKHVSRWQNRSSTGSDVLKGALQFLLCFLFLAQGCLVIVDKESAEQCAGVIVGGLSTPLPYHHHCADNDIGVGYGVVEDNIDTTTDGVLYVVIPTVGVIDLFCVCLMDEAQGAIYAELEKTNVAEVIP